MRQAVEYLLRTTSHLNIPTPLNMNFDQEAKALLSRIIPQANPSIVYILQTFSTLSIHPIYQQPVWPEIKPAEWVRLQPALVIASFFITCPLALDYFYGILWGKQSVSYSICGQSITRFDLVYDASAGHPMPLSEARKVHEILNQLTQVIKIYLADLRGHKCHGVTATKAGWRFSPNSKGLRSEVFMPREYLDEMETASPNVLLRRWLGFAVTLAHETVHAFHNACNGIEDEMAFGNSRSCEMGDAFEHWVFGGMHQEIHSCDFAVADVFSAVLNQHGVVVDKRYL